MNYGRRKQQDTDSLCFTNPFHSNQPYIVCKVTVYSRFVACLFLRGQPRRPSAGILNSAAKRRNYASYINIADGDAKIEQRIHKLISRRNISDAEFSKKGCEARSFWAFCSVAENHFTRVRLNQTYSTWPKGSSTVYISIEKTVSKNRVSTKTGYRRPHTINLFFFLSLEIPERYK